MREFERLQLYRDHLEALLVTASEERSMVYQSEDDKTFRMVRCSGSENEELQLTLEHTSLGPSEKERLHSFSEFSSTQVSETSYRLPLGKDPRRAAGLVEAMFTRVLAAPEDYDVEVRVVRNGEEGEGAEESED